MTATIGAHAATPALPTRDQNPLLAGLALPMPGATRLPKAGDWELSAAFNWGSSAIVEQNAAETLIVDAETRELRLRGAWGLTDRLALQWQLPYRYTGAGSLDSFIDSWHDFFGLPEGNRNLLPEDRFRIGYERNDVIAFDATSSVHRIGDLSLGLAYAFAVSDRTHATIALDVELPTGDFEDFSGNGAIDLSALVAAEHRLGERWTAYGQAGVSLLGDGDLLPEQQRNVVWSGMLGIAFDAVRVLRLNLQFEAHSSAFDSSEIDYLGDAIVLTVGGSFRFEGWQLELGVSEDILVDASPDVVFIFGASRTY
jgi:hypothetical protein